MNLGHPIHNPNCHAAGHPCDQVAGHSRCGYLASPEHGDWAASQNAETDHDRQGTQRDRSERSQKALWAMVTPGDDIVHADLSNAETGHQHHQPGQCRRQQAAQHTEKAWQHDSTGAATKRKPDTMGRPPSRTVIKLPGSPLSVEIAVISRPEPTGPQRRTCNNVLMPRANVVRDMKFVA
jgi:hypothetical protein